ncbi:MAG: nucleotidyltransferase domain-containing protein [Phycisphaeraceae bacterium]|nr:nucleotidyltransferase domain-containing protein [Phycisphaeraceae bacterium]MCW5769637.1 nucleotidyltransferase domain-containing protein [Phycisphaeraceae bacterium]
MVINGITFPEDRIAELCRGAAVVRAFLFGSILSDRFSPESDVDVLVETDPKNPPGLLRLGGLQMDLSELIDRDVHLTMLAGVSATVRESLLAGARRIDAA